MKGADDDNGRGRRPEPPAPAGPIARWAWLALAGTCIALASAGAVLPLLPTTPFLLVAAYAAARSSPRLHRWIREHPRFGPVLHDWRHHRALRPRTKRAALILIAASWVIMMVTVEPVAARATASAVILAVAIFLATRPSGPTG